MMVKTNNPKTLDMASTMLYYNSQGFFMQRVVVIDALNMFIRNYIVNPMISTNGKIVGLLVITR